MHLRGAATAFLGASSRPRYGDQRGLWYGCWSNSFIHKRPFFTNTFAKLSQTPRLSFAEPMLGNNASDEDSFITCQTTLENHGSLLDSLVNMQSRNPFSGQIVADYFFLARFTGSPLQNALWLSPAPSQNFRGTFAKISLFTDPSHQQGAHQRKANTRGLGVWLLQSLTFGNLAAAFGACFLRLQKESLGSDSGRCKDVLQDHGSRILTFGSLAATYEGEGDCPKAPHRELNQNQTEILRYPSPAGPRAAGGGSPLQAIYNDDNIQLSRNFRE